MHQSDRIRQMPGAVFLYLSADGCSLFYWTHECAFPFLSGCKPTNYRFLIFPLLILHFSFPSCDLWGLHFSAKVKRPSQSCQYRLTLRMSRKNLPLRCQAYFSVRSCPVVPTTFQKQKNNPDGRKQTEQRGNNKFNE